MRKAVPVTSKKTPPPAGPQLLPVDTATLDALVSGSSADPHSVLGPHPHDGGVTVRVLRPMAQGVAVTVGDDSYALTHEHAGVFAGVLPFPEVPDYRLTVSYSGTTLPTDDPYRFLPTLGDMDLHLVGEGRHEQLWEVLGSHVRTYETLTGPVTGTSFAVWAPSAQGARVVGDFNYWDGVGHPMRSLGSSGVWELFVPDVGDGTRYKYQVLGRDGVWRQKADPMAFATEVPRRPPRWCTPPATSGATRTWLETRSQRNPTEGPMATYEVHLGSWRRGRSYTQLAEELVRLRQGPGVHPRRVPAGRRAPVRRLLGLPGHVLLRAHSTLRRPRRPQVPHRCAPPRRHRCHHRLGARALPQGRVGARALRRHPAVRAPGPPTGRAAGLGHARLRLRSSRGAKLPGRQRRVLARGVPRRRPAGGRGRLDALPGLLARGRRVDAEHPRWAREPRGHRLPPGDERDRLQAGAPASARSPRSRPRGRASRDRRTSAVSDSGSSGTWAGCTTPWAT